MSTLSRFARQQWLALVLLVLMLTGVGNAGGEFLRLGVLNRAPTTTQLVNQGDGPALHLRVKPGEAPLKVNSSSLVVGLNASRLQGKYPWNFAPASNSPNYLSSTGTQLVDLANVSNGPDPATLYRRIFVAPAKGKLVISVTGICTRNAKGTYVFFAALDNSARGYEVGTAGNEHNSCGAYEEIAVEARQEVDAKVYWQKSAGAGGGNLFQLLVLVYFEPEGNE